MVLASVHFTIYARWPAPRSLAIGRLDSTLKNAIYSPSFMISDLTATLVMRVILSMQKPWRPLVYPISYHVHHRMWEPLKSPVMEYSWFCFLLELTWNENKYQKVLKIELWVSKWAMTFKTKNTPPHGGGGVGRRRLLWSVICQDTLSDEVLQFKKFLNWRSYQIFAPEVLKKIEKVQFCTS